MGEAILPDYDYMTSMAEEIITSNNYTVTYATHYIFTQLEFTCSGAIAGWAVLALDNTGGGRPELSVWTPAGSGLYTKYAPLLYVYSYYLVCCMLHYIN